MIANKLGPYDIDEVVTGDCLDILCEMPDGCVHMCVTSPPYWGLRDYDLPPSIWGGDPDCAHSRQQGSPAPTKNAMQGSTETEKWPAIVGTGKKAGAGSFCTKCSAWKGCLGLEPLHDCAGWATGNNCGACYVCHLVEIFGEVRRVLRDDGVLFLNLGDSYAAGGGPARQALDKLGERLGCGGGKKHSSKDCGRAPVAKGLKPKDLCGIPWRVALALQADGWWLRRDIIWAKGLSFCPSYSGSSMPESVTDRPSTSHEYIFLFSKSKRYFYDNEAVKERSVDPTDNRKARSRPDHKRMPTEKMAGIRHGSATYPKRNLRSVWAINPKGYKEAHFATYPEALIRPMVLAGTSARGACPKCGSLWTRVVEKSRTFESGSGRSGNPIAGKQEAVQGGGETKDIRRGPVLHTATIGWRPTCDCPGLDGDSPWPILEMHPGGEANWPTVPCAVLDPFSGAGTTVLVAKRLGRHYIGIELNPEYVAMSEKRLAKVTGIQLSLLE